MQSDVESLKQKKVEIQIRSLETALEQARITNTGDITRLEERLRVENENLRLENEKNEKLRVENENLERARLYEESLRIKAEEDRTPQHWSSDQTTANPSKPFELVRVHDRQVLQSLQDLLHGNHIGQGGADHQGPRGYTRLKLQSAWEVGNRSLWGKYESERTEIKLIMTRMDAQQRSLLPHPKLRAGFARAGSELAQRGEPYESIVNEVHLLHGLGAPSTVHTIVAGGFNEHFSGGNAGTLFGDGIYMAEDSGKADQYSKAASRDPEQEKVDTLLYGASAGALQGKELRYIFVCRAVLGCILQVGQDTDHRLGTQEPVFAAGSRELALVPEHLIATPTHFHSELAEIAPASGFVAHDTHTEALGIQLRFREFIAFRDTQIYPELLMAYARE